MRCLLLPVSIEAYDLGHRARPDFFSDCAKFGAMKGDSVLECGNLLSGPLGVKDWRFLLLPLECAVRR